MGDMIISLIRTWVPLGVGFVLTWLAQNLGILIDDATGAAVTAFFLTVVTGIYYWVARLAEQKWPAAGILLGVRKQPTY